MLLEEFSKVLQTIIMTKEISPQSQVNILTLNRLAVLNEDNDKVLLSTFWKGSPVVMILLRLHA